MSELLLEQRDLLLALPVEAGELLDPALKLLFVLVVSIFGVLEVRVDELQAILRVELVDLICFALLLELLDLATHFEGLLLGHLVSLLEILEVGFLGADDRLLLHKGELLVLGLQVEALDGLLELLFEDVVGLFQVDELGFLG